MVLLAYLFGWSREQLGEHFHKPTGTVKTWLHRSFAELRAQSAAQDTAAAAQAAHANLSRANLARANADAMVAV